MNKKFTRELAESSKTAQNYVYDLETYQNMFCAVFNCEGREIVFEISARKNNLEELISFYTPENIRYAIGFNNVKFDAQVLHHIWKNREMYKFMMGSEICRDIYDFVQELIQKTNAGEFPPYAEWHFKVPQIDLFLMNHYDNKNKMTSLKWVEFSINHEWVQDLPYKFNMPLKADTFDEVIEYCKNDVAATRAFAAECIDLIKLRLSQQKQYPELNLLNKPDSSVGEAMFLHFMSDSMGIPKKELKKMRTHRGLLKTGDLLLPYINFKTPEFQAVHEYYKNAIFGRINVDNGKAIKVGTTARYAGINFDFGEGGIHASWDNRIFESDQEYDIVDIDVTSYYPNLAIENGYRPEHLGEAFSRVYKNIFEQRAKYPKGSIENLSYKIILNGKVNTFGI